MEKKMCVIDCPGDHTNKGGGKGYCLNKVDVNGKMIPQFCIEDGSNFKCVTDKCDWGNFIYNPVATVDKKPLCKMGAITPGPGITNECNGIDKSYVKGVWAKDWSYNPGEPGGVDQDGFSCRSANIKSNNPSSCSEDACKEKIEQNSLKFAKWNQEDGMCSGVIDCTTPGYLPSVNDGPKPNDNCLDNGICCDGKTCGDWCIGVDDYCLLDENGKLCGEHFNTDYSNDSELINGVASKNPLWCQDKCLSGWKNDTNNFCTVPTCDNVGCDKDASGNPAFTQYVCGYYEAPSRYIRSNCDQVGNNINGNGLYCCEPNKDQPSTLYCPDLLGFPYSRTPDPACTKSADPTKQTTEISNPSWGSGTIFYGKTCDSSCKVKGYKSGTLHGTSPFCDQSCSGKCGTNTCFKGDIVGSAWTASTDVIDYGDGCDVGADGKVCCCNN